MGITERFAGESTGPSVAVRIATRFTQLIGALIVAGLYAPFLGAEFLAHESPDGKFIFAEFVAGTTCLSCIFFLIPQVNASKFFPLDWILFICWLALFGTFAKLFLSRGLSNKDSFDNTGKDFTTYMKTAVYVDLFSVLLWFASSIFQTAKWLMHRKLEPKKLGREVQEQA